MNEMKYVLMERATMTAAMEGDDIVGGGNSSSNNNKIDADTE